MEYEARLDVLSSPGGANLNPITQNIRGPVKLRLAWSTEWVTEHSEIEKNLSHKTKK